MEEEFSTRFGGFFLEKKDIFPVENVPLIWRERDPGSIKTGVKSQTEWRISWGNKIGSIVPSELLSFLCPLKTATLLSIQRFFLFPFFFFLFNRVYDTSITAPSVIFIVFRAEAIKRGALLFRKEPHPSGCSSPSRDCMHNEFFFPEEALLDTCKTYSYPPSFS